MSSLGKMSVVSGATDFDSLPLSLHKKDKKGYDTKQVHIWLGMLNQGMRPKKWLKPSNKGTRVNWISVENQEEYEEGLAELESFIQQVNAEHGLDFTVSK